LLQGGGNGIGNDLMGTIHTIGHSNHTQDKFVALLQMHGVTAVADVRSSPYSRFTPQFNKEVLGKALAANHIMYAFLGNYLGARPNDPLCCRDGTVDFSKLCHMDYFHEGLERLRAGLARFSLAMMCSEKDPIQCHRMVLVCRHIRSDDTIIQHILEDGELEDNRDAERRLMEHLHIVPYDLFKSTEDLVEEAYDKQGERIAFHYGEEAQWASELVQR